MSIEVLQQSPLIGVSTQGLPGANGKNGANGYNGFGATYRPGDVPSAFTGDLVGEAASTTPLSAAGVVADPIEGNVYDLAGIGYVALRGELWLEPEAFFAIRMIFERSRDPVLYESTAVAVGIQWLDAEYAAIEPSIAQVFTSLLVADGRQIFTARVPAQAGDGVPIDPPPGAVFWRPFIQDASVNGVLRVLGMTVSDVTNAGVYSPDLVRINQRLVAVESNINFKNPPFCIVRVPPCLVANLPAPGMKGRKGFATDGRASNDDGTIELPGKGTGVDVSDNGQAWVRIGTNKAVQA